MNEHGVDGSGEDGTYRLIKPDARRLPKLSEEGRKSYELTNEAIEEILIEEEVQAFSHSRR